MIRNRKLRRTLGIALVVAGGLAIWLPVNFVTGVVLVALGLALEVIGLHFERTGA